MWAAQYVWILSDLKLLKGGENKGEGGEKNNAKADEGKYLNNKFLVRKQSKTTDEVNQNGRRGHTEELKGEAGT
jgi:hypothetical protein